MRRYPPSDTHSDALGARSIAPRDLAHDCLAHDLPTHHMQSDRDVRAAACGDVASERWADTSMSEGSVVIGCFRDPAGSTVVAGDVMVVGDVWCATSRGGT